VTFTVKKKKIQRRKQKLKNNFIFQLTDSPSYPVSHIPSLNFLKVLPRIQIPVGVIDGKPMGYALVTLHSVESTLRQYFPPHGIMQVLESDVRGSNLNSSILSEMVQNSNSMLVFR
jgi:hypothetical protein